MDNGKNSGTSSGKGIFIYHRLVPFFGCIKKRGNPFGFPLAIQQCGLFQLLTLGELEAGACCFPAVLFTFFYA